MNKPSTLFSLTPDGKLLWKKELEDSGSGGNNYWGFHGPVTSGGRVLMAIKKSGAAAVPSMRAYTANGNKDWDIVLPNVGLIYYPILLNDGKVFFSTTMNASTGNGIYLVSVQTDCPGRYPNAWSTFDANNQCTNAPN